MTIMSYNKIQYADMSNFNNIENEISNIKNALFLEQKYMELYIKQTVKKMTGKEIIDLYKEMLKIGTTTAYAFKNYNPFHYDLSNKQQNEILQLQPELVVNIVNPNKKIINYMKIMGLESINCEHLFEYDE